MPAAVIATSRRPTSTSPPEPDVEAAAASALGTGGPVDSSTVQGPAGLPVQGRHGGRICVEARAAAGSTQRAHGERGPPRA